MIHHSDIRVATEQDAVVVGSALRPYDLLELRSVTVRPPVDAILDAMRASWWTRTWEVDGKPVCVFGVASRTFTSDTGCPWLLATPLVERHSAGFMRRIPPHLNEMRAMFRVLENHVLADNNRTVKWLERLGFVMGDPKPWGRLELPFRRFELRS